MPQANNAVMLRTDMDLWHHRIISGVGEVSDVNLGFIVSDTTTELQVYNSHLVEQKLVRVDLINLEGISVAEATGKPPINLAPLRTKKIVLEISLYGSTKIDGKAVLRFENGQIVTINLKGTRGLIWNIEPNWDEPLREKFAYKTDVIVSYNKNEQRRGFMSQPRRGFSHMATPTYKLLSTMRNVLYAMHNKPILCPVWWQPVRLRETCIKGSTRLKCVDLAGADTLQTGSMVLLWNNPFDYELAVISSFDGNDILLQASVSRTFYATAVCYPSVDIRLDPTVTSTNLASAVSFMDISADVIGKMNNIGKLSGAEDGLEMLNGVEVLSKIPNWAEEIVEKNQSDATIIDYGFGSKAWFNRGVNSMVSRELTFLSRTRVETAWWRRFIQRQKGQLKSFYVPTETKDLVVANDIRSTINSLLPIPKAIDVEDHRVSAMLKNASDRKFLRIRAKGKSYFFTIDRIEALGENARIHVKEEIAVTILKEDVTSACFVQRMRLASDDIEIEHVTSTVAKIKLSLQQVKEI